MNHHTQYRKCCSLKLAALAVGITVTEEKYQGEKACDKGQRHSTNTNKLNSLIIIIIIIIINFMTYL